MPSLSDIPPPVQPANQRAAFIEWLSKTPVTQSVRRELGYLWTGSNETTFTHNEWLQALRDAIPG